MKRTAEFILIACVCALTRASAQEITVIDQITRLPVEHAAVHIAASGQVIQTSHLGRATLPPGVGSDTVVVRHLAFQVLTTTRARLAAAGYRIELVPRLLPFDDVVVSASKWEQDPDAVPNQIAAVQSRDIVFTNPQTVPDMFSALAGVYVQKSQMGGGSPVLRGFEANRVLLVLDGVRLNNAIYRSGHLQSTVTQDASSLERAEVVFGPGSVMYGSDALGGVMDLHSLSPRITQDGMHIGGTAFIRHATANSEKTGHADLNLGFSSIASMTSITYSDFGDLRSGNIHDPAYPDWGKRFVYAARENGTDIVKSNDNPNIQKGTAYSQLNAVERLAWAATDALTATYGFYYSTSSDIPRYDRLNETSGGTLKYAEWNYGPQNWMMNTLTLSHAAPVWLYDQARLVLAHQNIDEDRITRRFGKNTRTHQEEDVAVTSANLDMDRTLAGGHQLFYGIEAVYNDVGSGAYAEDIRTGARMPAATRYPDGGSTVSSLAAYLSSRWALSERVSLTAGARYSRTHLSSTFHDTTFYHFPFTEAKINTGALTGSIGLVAHAGRGWQVRLNTSSGFRAPNVDDIGKVFDTAPGRVVVPNPDLHPEYAWNAEIGIARHVEDGLSFGLNGFYTLLTDAIVQKPYRYNGQDSIIYDGTPSQVVANANTNEACIAGVNAQVRAHVTQDFTIDASLTWTRGRDKSNDVPLDHIPPVYGQVRLMHRLDRFTGECSVVFNGWKYVEDYSPSGEDNLPTATALGTPAWYTINLRASYQLFDAVQLNAGLENILDVHYRTFASGVSAPGRNLYVTVRAGI